MRLIIAAPANGTELKNALKARLQNDPRVGSLKDLSDPAQSYPQLSVAAAREILICGTGIGTAIAANKVKGVRAATAHDLLSVRGAVENYNAQIWCLGQNIIATPAACALADIWLDLRHDTQSSYAPKVGEIDAFERGE